MVCAIVSSFELCPLYRVPKTSTVSSRELVWGRSDCLPWFLLIIYPAIFWYNTLNKCSQYDAGPFVAFALPALVDTGLELESIPLCGDAH